MQITAGWLGLTYEQWNVILFVIIHPAITLTLLLITWWYYRKYKKIKQNRSAAGLT